MRWDDSIIDLLQTEVTSFLVEDGVEAMFLVEEWVEAVFLALMEQEVYTGKEKFSFHIILLFECIVYSVRKLPLLLAKT